MKTSAPRIVAATEVIISVAVLFYIRMAREA